LAQIAGITIDRGSVEASDPGQAFAALLEAEACRSGEWRARSVRSGTEIFAHRQDATPVCILTRGLVKLCYPMAGGEVWTKSFIVDQGVFGPVSATEPAPSFGALALEECSLGVVRLAWVTAQLEANPALRTAASGFQAWLLERKRQREEDLLCLAAEARYLAFIRRDPDLAQRLELQEIAAFLRITPVALSRIRRRLRLRGDLATILSGD
jgi:CRP/FNR family transcriptional regulator, anaerobic regulatory protein